ncbi:MAG: cell division protein ZapA [Pseudohongiellaceae bacterium]|nr:cell division protein ZapA [Pseudohongiellaceae bacterium]
MSEENMPDTVKVRILEKEYQVSCPPSEQEALLKSARYLDENMRKIKARGNIHGLEKIAVMAALNITHEMLGKSQQLNQNQHLTVQQLRQIEDKIDLCLHASRQIEIS